LLLVAAAVLAARRGAGALALPLSFPVLLIVAAGLTVAALAIRATIAFSARNRQPAWRSALERAAVSLAVVSLGAAISLPGTSPLGLVALWLLLGIEEVWAWTSAGRKDRLLERLAAWRRGLRRADAVAVEPRAAPIETASGSQAELEHELLHADDPPAEDVLQQLTRSRGADGTETLAGWLRVAMAAGQRNTSVHVAFCPPFARTPRVSVEALEGPELRVKVVQALPYGARCDLKLAGMSEAAATVLLRFSAQAEAMPPSPAANGPAHSREHREAAT